MIYLPDPVEATFVKKLNRFLCNVWVDGVIVEAHIPNTGRLTELMVEGKRALLSHVNSPTRKTEFTLRSLWHNRRWVCIDSSLPNALAYDLAIRKALPLFKGYSKARREFTVGKHRFDLLLTGSGEKDMLVEVKSVTLVEKGMARFPDAPTLRGRSHVDTLANLAKEDYKCAVLFIIQRSDAKEFSPNKITDPAFAQSLMNASASGVVVKALSCNVGRRSINVTGEIPVKLK